MISQVVMQRGHSNLLTSTFSSLSPAIASSLGLLGIGSTILYCSPNITKLFHIQRALLVQIISLLKHGSTFTFSADTAPIAGNASIQTQCCLQETQEIGHFLLMLFMSSIYDISTLHFHFLIIKHFRVAFKERGVDKDFCGWEAFCFGLAMQDPSVIIKFTIITCIINIFITIIVFIITSITSSFIKKIIMIIFKIIIIRSWLAWVLA